MKQRWKLTLSYDGTDFHGWQIQPGLPTVQKTLADVIQHVIGEQVLPHGSGRTDAGVHALGQVASFSLEARIPPDRLRRALNRVLPSSIRVLAAEPVPDTFHARHSTRAKTYEYRIFQRRRSLGGNDQYAEEICPPFIAPYVWDCRWPVSLARMKSAASHILGTHNFASFAASDPEKAQREDGSEEERGVNPVKTIWESAWHSENDLLVYRVRGSGFLHHMVRNLVGTFVDVGRGSIEPGAIPAILEARNRTAAGPTAPPQGLFLRQVEYDEPVDPEQEATASV